MNPQGTVDPRNRLPWMIAGAAVIFALIILVRSELSDNEPARAAATEKTPKTVVSPRDSGVQTNNSTDAERAKRETDSAISKAVPQPVAQVSPGVSPSPTATPASGLYSMAGTIIDDTGNPIAGAAVRATYVEGSSQKTVNAVSSPRGQFEISGLKSPDLDFVVVEATGYSRSVIEKLKLPLPDRIEIALTPLAALEIGIEQIDTASGSAKPFSGEAQFYLLEKRGAASLTSTLAIRESAIAPGTYVAVQQQKVDIRNGKISLEELQPGEFKAAFVAGESYAESPPVLIMSGKHSATTVTLGRKWPFSGTISGEPSGKLLADAQLKLERDNAASGLAKFTPSQTQSKAGGRFSFDGIEPGLYSLTVSAAGYTTRTVTPVEIPVSAPPTDTSITLSQHRPAVRIRITSPDGQPIANCRLVLLMTSPATKSFFSQSDAAGQRSFENLNAGKYTLSATATDGRTRQKTVDFTLADGADQELQIVFGKTTRVIGIARQDGKPYHGILTFMIRGKVEIDNMVRTDEKGGYMVELESGEYMAGTPEKPGAQVVIVTPDQENRVDVEIK